MRAPARSTVRSIWVLSLVWQLLSPDPARADIYRYVDDEGKHHLVSDPSQIPQRFRSGAKRTAGAPSEPAVGAKDAPEGAAPPATRRIVLPSVQPGGDHVILEAMLNGSVRQRMIVDTGASMTVIPLATAGRLGLSLRPPYTSIAIQTASGTEVFPVVRLRSVGAGSAVVEDMPVVLNPHMKGMGLLGVDFLSTFNYSFNSDSNALTLETRDLSPREGFYGGRPEAWWRKKFDDLQGTVKDLRQLRTRLVVDAAGMDRDAVLRSGPMRGHSPREVLAQIDMSIRFWTGELSRIERNANEAGVPYGIR